ncbi:GNAT family N-acetyltransferase [Lacticaseibacillus mingshuiensis]|uniref:GNAT family N-acetyltransferase n=1 Tax=Lacticaseibacillus mingshuiensis TaxID=2799574 RepID=A0ABW4CFD5_9LACO|nr:GNAT family N-acetyltransferase [Lacticaseibacillus mingshuiensis]
MTVRPATLSDLKIISQMQKKLNFEMAKLVPDMIRFNQQDATAELADALVMPQRQYFIALSELRPAGFAAAFEATVSDNPSFVPHRLCVLSELWVDSNMRRQHLGTALLHAVDDWRNNRQLEYLQLDVLAENKGALAFYRASGFLETQLTMVRGRIPN